MALEAASLGVMAFLHLSGVLRGGTTSGPAYAGVAEAIIGAVLAGGAVAVWYEVRSARSIGMVATGFAIVGFLIGLRFTLPGGVLVDITYHVVTLPILVGTLVLLALWSGTDT